MFPVSKSILRYRRSLSDTQNDSVTVASPSAYETALIRSAISTLCDRDYARMYRNVTVPLTLNSLPGAATMRHP